MLSSGWRVSAMQFIRQWPASSAPVSQARLFQTGAVQRRTKESNYLSCSSGLKCQLMNFGWLLSPV
jgi:hypothetical protein